MSDAAPIELDRLLAAKDATSRDLAWDRLIADHSALLLRVAGSLGGGHDATMDRYAFVIEKLRQDDYRRLRTYSPDGSAKFAAWLVVVARRLCFDRYREHYGRPRSEDSPSIEATRVRRRIEDLLAAQLDLVQVADPAAGDPIRTMAGELSRHVLRDALATLEAGDRLLLKLRFENDLPAREIAHLLHLPTPFHVYRRLKTVLAVLRAAFARSGVDSAD